MSPRIYFVYGTLRPGGRFWPNVKRFIVDYEPGFIEDFELFHLPEGYPAIRPGAGRVFGDLLFVRSQCETLVCDIIDEIEGYDQPGRDNLYLRTTLDVRRLRAAGELALAATYLWAQGDADPLHMRGQRVESGDWREHMAVEDKDG